MSLLIKAWEQSGTYAEGIELLQLYTPDHDMLVLLKQGESPINRLYLRQAIAALTIEDAQTRQKQFTQKEGEAKWLHHRLKELYQLKAKRRNQYFDCHSDSERAAINRDLIEYRKEIHELCRKIEFYEKTGELPQIPNNSENIPAHSFDLSDDAVELLRDLQRTRSNISKAKKAVNEAYTARNRPNIEKYETKLNRLTAKKEALEHKLNTLGETKSRAI